MRRSRAIWYGQYCCSLGLSVSAGFCQNCDELFIVSRYLCAFTGRYYRQISFSKHWSGHIILIPRLIYRPRFDSADNSQRKCWIIFLTHLATHWDLYHPYSCGKHLSSFSRFQFLWTFCCSDHRSWVEIVKTNNISTFTSTGNSWKRIWVPFLKQLIKWDFTFYLAAAVRRETESPMYRMIFNSTNGQTPDDIMSNLHQKLPYVGLGPGDDAAGQHAGLLHHQRAVSAGGLSAMSAMAASHRGLTAYSTEHSIAGILGGRARSLSGSPGKNSIKMSLKSHTISPILSYRFHSFQAEREPLAPIMSVSYLHYFRSHPACYSWKSRKLQISRSDHR